MLAICIGAIDSDDKQNRNNVNGCVMLTGRGTIKYFYRKWGECERIFSGFDLIRLRERKLESGDGKRRIKGEQRKW